MIYFLAREARYESDLIENNFKNQVFASNPEMYTEIFKEDVTPDEEEIEYLVPDSEEELRKMMRQLKSQGVIS